MIQHAKAGARSHILYNGAIYDQSPEVLFEPASAESTIERQPLGRGSAFAFEFQGRSLILKHYERGGYPRRLIRDSYAYFGLRRTRMWREFHLLLQLQELGLPVPNPLAARCELTSPFTYRGDLVTERLPQTRTLAEIIENTDLSEETWTAIGHAIARFHGHNVFHADLNATNIMLDRRGGVFLIDFDKGYVRPRRRVRWAEGNLQRLCRSLLKWKRRSARFHFTDADWQNLQRGYQAGMMLGGLALLRASFRVVEQLDLLSELGLLPA